MNNSAMLLSQVRRAASIPHGGLSGFGVECIRPPPAGGDGIAAEIIGSAGYVVSGVFTCFSTLKEVKEIHFLLTNRRAPGRCIGRAYDKWSCGQCSKGAPLWPYRPKCSPEWPRPRVVRFH